MTRQPGNHIAFLFSAVLFCVLIVYGTSVTAASILNQVTRVTEPSRIQIFLKFSEIPEHSSETIGRRLDLNLTGTLPAESLQLLTGDDKMIKMISNRHQNDLLLSFYFRYAPQDITVRSQEATSSLMVDILLGNPFSSRYPDLSSRLHGVTVLNRNEVDFTNPLHASLYGDQWQLFIQSYESKVSIHPRQRFTLPPFPMASFLSPVSTVDKWLPKETISLAEAETWPLVAEALIKQLETESDEKIRNRLLLSYAECLLRDDQYHEPFKLLQKISLTYPDSQESQLSQFLFVYLLGTQEDPFQAFTELEQLEKHFSLSDKLLPYVYILQAELALATDRTDEAMKILARDNVAYMGEANFLRLLRQADVYFKQNDFIKALVAYLKLGEQTTIIEQHPASLANFSDALYTNKRFKQATETYQQLIDLVSGTEQQGLAMFRQAMSSLHADEKQYKIYTLFSQIQDAFPASEAAYRSWLKQTDLQYLSGRNQGKKTAEIYGEIGKKATRIELREEALLKQAMVTALLGAHETSIHLAMDILKDFRHGHLTVETKSLILAQLPGVLKDMIVEKKYIAALVLAKKNRLFFARGWLNINLLYDLANAYVQLGLYDRATRTYQYIFEVSSGEEREKVYVPLLEALYEGGQYSQIEDYASRYFFRYPDGPSQTEVFFLRLKALYKNKALQMAARVLEKKGHPTTPQIEQLAGKIFFELGQWKKVATLLTTEPLLSSWTGANRDYFLAESLFQKGAFGEAQPLFSRLQEESSYSDQALFRLAEIALQNKDRKSALKQFQQLAEKGKDPRWIKMANEEIAILQMNINTP